MVTDLEIVELAVRRVAGDFKSAYLTDSQYDLMLALERIAEELNQLIREHRSE